MTALSPLKESLELKKHIYAVHSFSEYSLIEKKLFDVLLHHSYKDLPYQSEFRIPTLQLCSLIGYNSNDYGLLKKSLKGLMERVIEWNVIDERSGKKQEVWKASALLADAELGNGICTYSYSNRMREFLYRPEIYARIDISLIPFFGSKYGFSLYENTIRYEKLSATPDWEWGLFRKLMGVSEKTYPRAADFCKRVLYPAVEEVNKIANIIITAKIQKKGHSIIKVGFKIQKKVNIPREVLNNPLVSTNEELDKIMQNGFKLSSETTKELFERYTGEYIAEKISYVKSTAAFKNKEMKQPAAYLITALKKDFKTIRLEAIPSPVTEVKAVRPIHTGLIERVGANKEIEKNKSYNQYVGKAIDDYLTTLSPDKLMALMESFEKSIKGKELHKLFLEHGTDDSSVKKSFYRFCNSKFFHSLKLKSFLEFEKTFKLS